jgi:hypothetical protein
VGEDGSVFVADGNVPHYIDLSTPSMLLWTSERFIPTGVYDSVVFNFGLLPACNVSGYFVNPPESNMFWPDMMGGGYHFMKIDGRWKNESDTQFNTFGLHLGGGDVQAVRLSFAQKIFITENDVIKKDFDMALDKWFNITPFWDFNIYGGAIMQDTVARQVLINRIVDIFSVK